MIKSCYLEVTYRKGPPLAAYYYLPRHDDDTSARIGRVEGGLLVDYSKDGRLIRIEITNSSQVDISQLNQILLDIGLEAIAEVELAPLHAA